MDIVGAINHNLSIAGVRTYSREDVRNANGQLGTEVGFDIPTRRGRPVRLRAHVPYDDMMPSGVGYEEVGGKLARKIKKKIKKVAKKVGKLKVVKALVKVAMPLSNLVAPGAAAALKSGVKLIKKSAQMVKAAKGGNKKAAKALTAPLAFKVAAPRPAPARRALPAPRPAPRAPAPRALPAPAPEPAPESYDEPIEAPEPQEEEGPAYDMEEGGGDYDGGDGGDAGDSDGGE
jgi:hypothetical protein